MENHFLGSDLLKPIQGESVVQQIVKQLVEHIYTGKFSENQKLPSEFELMEQLNVGRNSLREAIKILEALGILEIRRGEGTYICTQNEPTVFDSIIYGIILESSSKEEIIELRQLFDQVILKLAVSRCTEEDIILLEANLEKMISNFGKLSYKELGKIDYEFHLLLIDSCKSAFLSRVVKGVYKMFEFSICENIRREENFANSNVNHRAILDCLKSKSVSKVENVIEESLSAWKRNVHNE